MYDLKAISLDAADNLTMSDINRHAERFSGWADRRKKAR